MAADPDKEPIICRTTPWYARRRLLLVGMFAAFAAWFFYDYKWAWPKALKVYEESVRVKAEPDGTNKWREIAKKNGWDESPKEMTPDKIGQQLWFAGSLGLVSAVTLVSFLIGRNRTLRADAEAFYTPTGRRVPFASAFKIDKRKWKHKGLATVYYKDESGATRSAVLDDLGFGGTDRILDRLMSQFSGELIDLEEDETTPGTDPPAETPAA